MILTENRRRCASRRRREDDVVLERMSRWGERRVREESDRGFEFIFIFLRKNNTNNAAATAYVCFTSGTTGRPKGVKTTRENIEAYARAKVKNEKLDASSIVALVSAHVFDPCIGDIASAIAGKSAIATFSPREALMRGGNALRNALAKEPSDARVLHAVLLGVWRHVG